MLEAQINEYKNWCRVNNLAPTEYANLERYVNMLKQANKSA